MSSAYQIYSDYLFAKAGQQGIPLSGTFELTARCNLDCRMCYIHKRANDAMALAGERTAAQWLALAEECRTAGTLLLLLTGGEPMLRPDFREIYTGCRRLGLMVSINSNAVLIDEDMLQPLNFDNIPNMKYIDEKYTHLDFDPEQKYSVPYTWGVVGIVYNTKYVDEADTGSWDLLWNPKYANRTAMFNNSRDALGIALMYLGCSLNTTDRDELRQAADLIIAGKPVYQGIWMDQILEKLPAEEIVAAPYYNGDAVTMIDENPDLAFYVPKEGTNLFVDAMCIPKNAKNVEGAEKFINFMCSTEAAMANWEYIGYSSPHTGVYEQLDEETRNDPLYFPDTSAYPTEAYTNLPKDISQYYNDLWVDILT